MIRFFKIAGKILLGLLLALVLIFTGVYLVYNEKLPEATISSEADLLAQKMLKAVNHEAYQKTKYIEWTFAGRNHYKWNRQQQIVEVRMGDTVVRLNIQQPELRSIVVNDKEVIGNAKTEAIESAISNFNNDSFWLVAPNNIFKEIIFKIQ